MKVYITSSTADFDTYLPNYQLLRDTVVEAGHVLTRDWLDRTTNRIRSHGDLSEEDIRTIYRECIDNLREADAVIVEDTVSNFSTGHQITLAQQFKIPTLVLWQGPKHKHFKQMFIHGIPSDNLEVRQYSTLEELPALVHKFLHKYGDAQKKNRFHLVLNNAERQYLDWAQYTKNRSRTDVIRAALRAVMENDEEYGQYLG